MPRSCTKQTATNPKDILAVSLFFTTLYFTLFHSDLELLRPYSPDFIPLVMLVNIFQLLDVILEDLREVVLV